MNEEIERKSEFDQNYVELGPKKYDPHLGEYKIKRNMTGNDLVFVKEYQSTSKSQAITVLNSLAKRKELKIVNLMQLKDFSCKDESHFCGSFYNYKSYYEYYELNLKLFKERLINAPDEIIEMILTKFVYDMVDVLADLEMLNITHGDIRPELIFVSRYFENGDVQFKLLDRVNEQGSAINSQLNNVVSSNNLYISPTYYNCIANGKVKSLGADAFRADVFSLGMVLLELGLLVTVQTVYDKKNNKFNSFALEKLKEQFYIKYRKDSILAQVLHLMLESDDSIRPDFIKLKERMPKLEQVKNYIQSQRNLTLSAGNASNPGNGPSIIVEKQSFVENPLARPPNDRVALPGTALYQPVGRPSQNESIMNPQSPSNNTPGQNPEFRRPLSHADRIPSQLNFENGESPGAPRDDRPPGMSDSNYNKAKSDLSQYLKDQVVLQQQQQRQPPSLKKKSRLFEDAANPSEPLHRDVADSPAKEHTQPDQAAWQNVRYYGQNPHEMIYSPPQNDPDFSSLMGRVKSNDQNFTVNSQPYARAPPANDVARAPTPYGDPALQQMMQPDYSRPNPQQSPHGQPTIDEYGRPISMRNPSPVSNTPTYQPEYENFMTPKSFEGQAFNFTEKPNNLAQMIMRDRPHVEPPQVNPNPRPNVNEDWGNTVGGNQRSTARAGPAMMLNSSLNDSKPQNQSRPQVPMFDYQDKSKAGIGSPQSFSIPMSNAPSQTGASRPGLNKFAPLDASPALPLMKTASPFSNPSDPTFSQPSVRSGPQQFLSRDPVLQSAGRPYF